MIELAVTISYSLLFFWIILKMNFFKITGVGLYFIPFVFLLKIISGVFFQYCFHQFNGSWDADNYFADGNAVFQVIHTQPLHYLQLLLGINNSADYLKPYYEALILWTNQYADPGSYCESRLIIRFNAFVRLFSFGYFHVHTVFMCFLSTIGLAAIYKTFIPFLLDKKKELLASVFFFPSIMFWGSTVMKEGLLIFAIGLLIFYFHKIIFEKFTFKSLFWVLLAMAILLYTRYYILAAIIPGLLANWWIVKSIKKKPVIKYLTVFVIYFLIGLNFQYVFPKFNALKIIARKQIDFDNLTKGGTYMLFQEKFVYIKDENKKDIMLTDNSHCKIKPGSDYNYWNIKDLDTPIYVTNSTDTSTYFIIKRYSLSGSRVNVERLTPELKSIAESTPGALINTLFRPHLFEAKTLFSFLSAIENAIIALMFVVCLIFFKKPVANLELFYFCLTFVIIAFALTGLITPVLGALVRYRVPILPFLFISLLMVFDKEKFLRRFPFLGRFIN